ncbi:hypothetical protein [Haloarcula onubensis]|uniref:Uncharacterized protein n=1 Tax=Haloarcula onubensis TaxID=2950539 RepID=A0ABU2FR51_9EURY|nr:hypothetical protein [Halomicroarcula sp. S3CR25-11]MDS0283244.1 hypothetical protein [Halomicroarcula sp. S3CR25-11]
MRCSHPTSDLTDRQASCSTAAKTFSVGFGKWSRLPAGLDRAAATRGESGYPQH